MLSLALVPVTMTESGLAVRRDAAARGALEIDVHVSDAGAGEVADRDGVGAAEGVEVDVLDRAEVHRDGGDVAREPDAGAVSRDVDLLVHVGAVERHRVVAVAAVDGVAAVAGVPDEGVVAGTEVDDVVAAAAVDDVVAVAAEKCVVAVAAGDGVVAGSAVDGDVDEGREAVAGGKRVVAAVHVDDEVLGRADVEGKGRGARAVEPDTSPVGGHGEDLGAVAAVDLNGVDAVAPFVEVGAFAGVPDHGVVAGLAEDLVGADAAGERVVAGAAEEEIVAPLAEEDVVAGLAEEHVGRRAADQGVVAVAAEQHRAGQSAVGFVELKDVVAGQAEDFDGGRVRDGGAVARDPDGAAVDEDAARGVAADRDGVVRDIADHVEQSCRRAEGGGDGRLDAFGQGVEVWCESLLSDRLAARDRDEE